MNEKGHAEKVPKEQKAGYHGQWYVSNHAVMNENKKKVRIIFDCAAGYQGAALSDRVIHAGPNLPMGYKQYYSDFGSCQLLSQQTLKQCSTRLGFPQRTEMYFASSGFLNGMSPNDQKPTG